MKIRTKKLWLFRWDKIKSNRWVWVLFIVSIAISFAINAFVNEQSEASCMKALIAILNNVSYGYIAGFLFYLLSDFIPSTDKELTTTNFNIDYLKQILDTMDVVEEGLLEDKKCFDGNKAWSLASAIVEGGLCGLNLADKGDNIVTPLNPKAINIITYGRKRIDDYVTPNLSKGSLSFDPVVSSATSLCNGFFNMSRTFGAENKLCIFSRDLAIVCEEYYIAKQCVENRLKEMEKYYYEKEN